MFKLLPVELQLNIWYYDNSIKMNYNKCIHEINEKYKKSIYYHQSPYQVIMYYNPTLNELNNCLNNLNKNLFKCHYDYTFIFNEISINRDNEMFYLSKTFYYYKKEHFFKLKIN
jgi:hypothetical protein